MPTGLAIFLIILAYFLGGIPFGYIIARKIKNIDIRNYGSGNIGATNVYRIVGKKAGIATFILDFAKGFVAVYLYNWVGGEVNSIYKIFAAILVILGHNYPIFLKFKGGKGVSTTLGATVALTPLAAVCSAGVWLLFAIPTRTVSLGSIAAGIFLPVFCFIFSYPLGIKIYAIIAGLFILIRHKSNIKRLKEKKEYKFKWK